MEGKLGFWKTVENTREENEFLKEKKFKDH